MFISERGFVPVLALLVGAFVALTGLVVKNNLSQPTSSPQVVNAHTKATVAPASTTSSHYGVHVQLVSGSNGLSQDQTELTLAKQTGAGFVRIGVSWKLLEQYGK